MVLSSLPQQWQSLNSKARLFYHVKSSIGSLIFFSNLILIPPLYELEKFSYSICATCTMMTCYILPIKTWQIFPFFSLSRSLFISPSLLYLSPFASYSCRTKASPPLITSLLSHHHASTERTVSTYQLPPTSTLSSSSICLLIFLESCISSLHKHSKN